MLRLKISDDRALIILDPGNVRRMKDLQPLVISTNGVKEIAIVITPNMAKLNELLKLPITDVELDNILKSCKDLPEMEMPVVVDGNARLTN